MLEILNCASQSKSRKTSSDINALLVWINKRLPNRVTIPELANRMQLSPSRFMARFKSEVGMIAGEYILRRRVESGCAHLAAGDSVLDAAMKTGFCSSQYFATVFKRLMQQTPREFQRSILIMDIVPCRLARQERMIG